MIHNEYALENPRINQQDRQKITFPGSAYPKEISQQWTPATHTEAVHCQGVLHSCLWPLKAPGSTLGEGRQTSRQPTDASTVCKTCKAPVTLSPPTNQHPTFYRSDTLVVTQTTVSKHWRESNLNNLITQNHWKKRAKISWIEKMQKSSEVHQCL